MTTEHGPRPEPLRQENLIITPESITRDNRSHLAEERRNKWNEAKRDGNLIAYFRCADARVQPTGIEAMSLGSIAAAFKNPEALAPILSDKGIKASVVLAHVDGETVKLGEMPAGCGGLAAKKDIGNSEQNGGTAEFISEVVIDKDPVVQSLWTAKQIAIISNKPTMAAIEDHRTHQIYPVGFFNIEKGQMISIISTASAETTVGKYQPEKIYADGLPVIDSNILPEVFTNLLEQNQKETMEELSKYPDLKRMQKVQRPRMVWFTTDPSSLRQKVPDTASIPGSIFKVHAIREKINGIGRVDDELLKSYLGELQYPLEHSVENSHDTSLPFSNTDRLIIETGDLELSKTLAEEVIKQEWMQKWTRLNGRRIILLQTNSGVINAAEYFGTA